MAQVEIKSSEGLFYPVKALAQAQGLDILVGEVALNPIVISVQDCAREPREVHSVLQAPIEITDREVTLPISVIDVSGTRPFVNLVGR